MIGLVKSELLKVRTTHTWWILLLVMTAFTAVALVVNLFMADQAFEQGAPQPQDLEGLPAGERERILAQTSAKYAAANVYTSGQYFGLLLAMVIGILIVTNEFRHQTATATFLAMPRRVNVVLAKLVAALAWGAIFATVATILSVIVGGIFFTAWGEDLYLSDPDVVKAVLLNVLAFGVWATFGLGLGTLLKNQIGALVTALLAYLIGQRVLQGILLLLAIRFDQEWVLKLLYWLPSGASQVMTSAVKLASDAPSWWGGALILLGYGAVATGLGSAITLRRDIS